MVFAENVFFITYRIIHSLEASNLINGKTNREPGMEGAGETSGYGFMFASTTTVTLFTAWL